VIAISWTYSGLNPEEFEGRVTLPYERFSPRWSTTFSISSPPPTTGLNVVKVYLQPGASLETANAQVTAASQFILSNFRRGSSRLKSSTQRSSVPILQLGVSGKGLNEQQLNDYSLNFIRPQLITVPGAVVPLRWRQQRQIMVNMDQRLMQSKGLSPSDVLGR